MRTFPFTPFRYQCLFPSDTSVFSFTQTFRSLSLPGHPVLSMSPDLTQGGFEHTTSGLGITVTQTCTPEIPPFIPIYSRIPTSGLGYPYHRNILLLPYGPYPHVSLSSLSWFTPFPLFSRQAFGSSLPVSLELKLTNVELELEGRRS